MSGGKGKNTTSTSSAPPPEVMEAWKNLWARGNDVANAPLTDYAGPNVAPFTPMQEQGFNTINQSQGISLPYIQQGMDYLKGSTNPIWDPSMGFSADKVGQFFDPWKQNVMDQIPQFSGEAIKKYMDPYLDQVVGATEAGMVEDERRQQNDLRGNAISQGAWGGDRAGIAGAELARQQKLAHDSTIANLRSQGYGQALSQFNTDKNLDANLRGQGYGIAANQMGDEAARQLSARTSENQFKQNAAGIAGNLGSQAQSDIFGGAQALINAGGAQQNLAQQYIDMPYQQFQQRQAYPWQSTQFLSNLLGSWSGNAGGTSSSTAPGPSAISQIGGLALAAAPFFLRSGGRIRRASGGRVSPYSFIPVDGWNPIHSSIPAAPAPYRDKGMDMNSMAGISAGLMNKKHANPWVDPDSLPNPGIMNEAATSWTDPDTGHGYYKPWRNPDSGRMFTPTYADGGDVYDMEQDGNGDYATQEALAPIMMPQEDPPPPMPDAEEGGAAPTGGMTPEASNGIMSFLSKGGADPKMAMIMAGLGMAAGESPNALTNIAHGGLMGMQNLAAQRKEVEMDAYHKGQLDNRAKQLEQQADHWAQQMDLAKEGMGIKRQALAMRGRPKMKPTDEKTRTELLARLDEEFPGIEGDVDPEVYKSIQDNFFDAYRESGGDFEAAFSHAVNQATGGNGLEDKGWIGHDWQVPKPKEAVSDNILTPENLEFTAKKHGITVEEVKKRLGK